jgi:hypothetical protein
MTRNQACTHTIEHLVDGLADHMRIAVASHASGTIGCRKSYNQGEQGVERHYPKCSISSSGARR